MAPAREGSPRKKAGKGTEPDPDEAFWRGRVARVGGCVRTPGFVFAEEPLAAGVAELEEAFRGIAVRHWWSYKTLPLGPAVRWWHGQGRPVEVVSERELVETLALGVPAEAILVNGPAKHAWLPRHEVRGLRVNLDSPAEAVVLAPLGRRWNWRMGVRLSTESEENHEYPGVRTQFGLLAGELAGVLRRLRRHGLRAEVLHFHLRTNVPEPRCYAEGAEEALAVAAAAGWRPEILDLGGGFPPRRVASRKGSPLDAGFSLASMREVVIGIRSRHRQVREFWMENGRRLTAPAGVLAIRVLEVKEGRGVRTAICDGGRTLHAMVATWERHRVAALNPRRGRRVPTLLCGPTCMAFDNLGIHDLPAAVRAGDVLLWMDAGAYQLSWETRFSHELASVLWTAGDRVETVRGGGRLSVLSTERGVHAASPPASAEHRRSIPASDRRPGPKRAEVRGPGCLPGPRQVGDGPRGGVQPN